MKPKKILLILLTILVLLSIIGYRVLRPIRVSVKLAEKVPLAAEAAINTNEPSRITVRIFGRDGEDLEHDFDSVSKKHRVPILGLYPDYKNRLEIRAQSANGETFTEVVEIETEALPDYYPDIRVERLRSEEISPGMLFMHLGHYDDEGGFHPLASAIDRYGRVRWFYDGDFGHLLRRLDNGNLLIHRDDSLVEIDMLGRETGKTWSLETGVHHDAVETPDGNFLVLTSAQDSFDDGVVEIERGSADVIRGWDFRRILDPERPRQPLNLEEKDWLHLNGIDYEPRRDSFVVSGRDQSVVVKLDRKNGQIEWILGNHRYWKEEFKNYLLKPAGEAFEWPWGQHAPMFHPEDPNRILIYDNGNERSYDDPLGPEESYSRAVEYRIDPQTMEIEQLWEYGRRYGSRYYTPFIGDANYLAGGNRLVCFGGITRDLDGAPMEIFDFEAGEINRMKISAVIVEVSSDSPAEEIFRVRLYDDDNSSYRGYRSYRAEKMSLYPN
ncbi:MAG TPA: hypothetical protein ENN41_03375 [Sediminispirochaeta sp.]|nr:hypothetical protein [Sediminispirochaeta sp.]